MPRSKRHIHQYQSKLINSTSVWACALPDCSHYMPDHMKSMVPGKASICNQCGAQFVLDSDAMREDKPRCLDCRGLSVEEDFPMTDVLREFVDKGGL